MDFGKEKPLTIQAAADCESVLGRRVSRATMYRWVYKGVGGVKLQTVMSGGRRLTTQRWLNEFLAKLNRQDASRAASVCDGRRGPDT